MPYLIVFVPEMPTWSGGLHAVSPPDYDEDVARGPGISGVGSENDGVNE